MNTRLQVEHPVTEWVTGLDLVRWQIHVAQGEQLPLPRAARAARARIEARVYAEDPAQQLHAVARAASSYLRVPGGPDVRDDSGVYAGLQGANFTTR